MMSDAFLLSLYGLLFLSGAFLSFFWGRLSLRRIKDVLQTTADSYGVNPPSSIIHRLSALWHDRYLVIATSLTLNSLGTMILFSSRTVYGMLFSKGRIAQYDGLFFAALTLGLFVMVVSKSGFMWSVHMNHKQTVWRIYMLVSVAWVAFSIYWVFNPTL